MSAALDSYADALAQLLEQADRAEVAEQVYGFDQTTARRLAFYRWLHDTGRLTDGTP